MPKTPQTLATTVRRAMQGPRHVRVPLNLKLSALIVSLLAVTVFLVSGFLLHAQQQTLTEEMRKRGLTIAQNLAAGARSALLTKDDLALALLVRDAMRDADVAYVAITDRNGKVVEWRLVLEMDGKHANARRNIEQAERILRTLSEEQPPLTATPP